MIWHKHLDLEGLHAPFSASQYQWLNYSQEKMIDSYFRKLIPQMGTVLHDYARQRITHFIKMSKQDGKAVLNFLLENDIPREIIDIERILDTMIPYVNDAIGYRMTPEVVIRYSDFFFGTADAINYNEKKRFLRIHDFKSGEHPAKMEQLEIYTALFCLEYGFKPVDIEAELRIYQNGEVVVYVPTVDTIVPIMDKIVSTDKILQNLNVEGE